MKQLTLDNATVQETVFRGVTNQYIPPNVAMRIMYVVLTDMELAKKLSDEGFKVYFPESRPSEAILTVRLSYNLIKAKHGVEFTPSVSDIRDPNAVRIFTEADVAAVDFIEPSTYSANLVIRPFYWDVHGQKGVTAFLESMTIINKET